MRTSDTPRRQWWRAARRPEEDPPIRLRPMHAGDPAVQAVFDGLSATSRRLRFHTPTPQLTESMARRLHAVDGRRSAAVVAEVRTAAGFVPAGIARLEGTDELRARMAVEVVDRRQGQGIGALLVSALADLARECGYRELYADVLAENVRALLVLRRVLPGTHQVRTGRTVRVSCPLDWSDLPADVRKVLADLSAR